MSPWVSDFVCGALVLAACALAASLLLRGIPETLRWVSWRLLVVGKRCSFSLKLLARSIEQSRRRADRCVRNGLAEERSPRLRTRKRPSAKQGESGQPVFEERAFTAVVSMGRLPR